MSRNSGENEEEENPIKHSSISNMSEQQQQHCNPSPSDGQMSSEETETSNNSEIDGATQYASSSMMFQNGQYPHHPYDPYSTHTIIGQSGLPLSIPFGLLHYAQYQEDSRIAKNKGLRRGKWTVRLWLYIFLLFLFLFLILFPWLCFFVFVVYVGRRSTLYR